MDNPTETPSPSEPGDDHDDSSAGLDVAAELRVAGDGLSELMVEQIEEATEPLHDEEQLLADSLELASTRYRLDAHAKDDLRRLVDAYRAMVAGATVPEERGLKPLRHALSHDEVLAAACEVMLARSPGATEIAALHDLAMALLVNASTSAAAGARVLLARCAEHERDHRVMESQIDAALESDPQYWPALVDAAWFAEDRGDAVRASSLLTETRVPAYSGEVTRLSRYIRSGDHKVGRNDPCPCGSGRKYKACCLGRGGFSLAERSGWLMDKVQGFLARGPQRPTLETLVFAAAGTYQAVGDEAYRVALEDYPMVVEIALFEGGVLADFLAQRGYLLPDDERELAESWIAAKAGLWELVSTNAGGAPAERSVVLERGGEQARIERPGQLVFEEVGCTVLARPLMVEGLGLRVLVAAAIPDDAVPLAEQVLSSAPVAAEDLARLVGKAAHIPPATVDDGDPLVLCLVSYTLPEGTDPQRIADLLDGDLLDFDESGEWIEPEDAPQIDDDPDWAPNGSVVLYEGEVVVRAGSEVRADRLKAVVERLVPEAELTRESRRPRAEIVEEILNG